MSENATATATITNIAAYQFATLTDLKSLREHLISLCKGWGLKGTILLSTEGINLFVAGLRPEIDLLLAELRSIEGLETLTPKFSESAEQPFRRMLVRIKKEIIAFGVEGIEPAKYTSPRIEAKTLKQWLDEGRPVTLLDTRNDYEVKLGTFKGAHVIGVDHFRDFPEAVRKLPEELKNQPIVTFCTGGIRCEKAAPFMEREGFQQVWQLEGGILKYFEEVGGAHYDGECFVFDQRVGVDPALSETEATQCFMCQSPLSEDDQKDVRFVEHVSCPYCFKTTEQQMQENMAKRHAAIQRVVTPLPGSAAYDHQQPLNVPRACDGMTLLETLVTILPHVPRTELLMRFENQRILDRDERPVLPQQIVRAGERYLRLLPGMVEPDVNADIRLLHEDEAVVVLEKPAPLPMHAGGRFNRNTLDYILHEVYLPQKPRPCHRLDANTTGLVVVARTRHFAGLVQPQFSRGEVEKVYLARVQGHPEKDAFFSDAPISDVPGALGSRDVDEDNGREARTEFRVIRRDADGTALVEARPITGRTNQIRIHLWQLGFPIVGDPVYLPGAAVGDTQTLDVEAAPLCLHAWKVSFIHPMSKERVRFETKLPSWA
ncbi:MAG: sulfurtransferase [Prosthecobacter sp.]|nr:sulfurtransferase [Prosthecobacter sp.]